MQHRAGTKHPIWLLAIVALVLAVLACEPPPVTGINCIKEQGNGSILAFEEGGTYISRDGGLSWQPSEPINYFDYCGYSRPSDQPWALTDPSNPRIIYRFAPNVAIERSDDGGATWRQEIDLSGTEARTMYYVRFRNDGYDYRAGPSDALIHSQTGNLVVAMSYEGVLVRTPQGRWSWIGVGQYQRADMRDLTISIPLIWGELLMGLAFALMTISTASLLARNHNLWIVPLTIAVTFVVDLLVVALLVGIHVIVEAIIFAPLRPDIMPIEPMLLFLLLLVPLPFVMSVFIARKTHQDKIGDFLWTVVGWTYLVLGWALANIDFRDSGGLGYPGSLLLTIVLVISGLMISVFMISRLYQTASRALTPTLIFGGTGFLIIAVVYFLWAIGGIAFYRSATVWAWGLGLLNLFIGSRVLKRFAPPAQPPDHPADGVEFLEPS